MAKFGDAKTAVEWAAKHMRGRRNDTQGLMPMVRGLFGMRDSDSDAMTILSVAQRALPEPVGVFFLYLHGCDTEYQKRGAGWIIDQTNQAYLNDLAPHLYHRVIWPTDQGTVHPYVGINVMTNLLRRRKREVHAVANELREYKLNFRGVPGQARLAEMLGWHVQAFRDFQRNQVDLLLGTRNRMGLWETQAENYINGELADKGMFSG